MIACDLALEVGFSRFVGAKATVRTSLPLYARCVAALLLVYPLLPRGPFAVTLGLLCILPGGGVGEALPTVEPFPDGSELASVF